MTQFLSTIEDNIREPIIRNDKKFFPNMDILFEIKSPISDEPNLWICQVCFQCLEPCDIYCRKCDRLIDDDNDIWEPENSKLVICLCCGLIVDLHGKNISYTHFNAHVSNGKCNVVEPVQKDEHFICHKYEGPNTKYKRYDYDQVELLRMMNGIPTVIEENYNLKGPFLQNHEKLPSWATNFEKDTIERPVRIRQTRAKIISGAFNSSSIDPSSDNLQEQNSDHSDSSDSSIRIESLSSADHMDYIDHFNNNDVLDIHTSSSAQIDPVAEIPQIAQNAQIARIDPIDQLPFSDPIDNSSDVEPHLNIPQQSMTDSSSDEDDVMVTTQLLVVSDIDLYKEIIPQDTSINVYSEYFTDAQIHKLLSIASINEQLQFLAFLTHFRHQGFLDAYSQRLTRAGIQVESGTGFNRIDKMSDMISFIEDCSEKWLRAFNGLFERLSRHFKLCKNNTTADCLFCTSDSNLTTNFERLLNEFKRILEELLSKLCSLCSVLNDRKIYYASLLQ